MNKVLLSTIFAITLLLAACGKEETTPQQEETPLEVEQVEQAEPPIDEAIEDIAEEGPGKTPWQDQVKAIATSDRSNTEKHDKVMKLVGDFKPTEDQVKQFEEYIVDEFKNRKYLSDPSNHEYMLNNLFQSGVIEKYYKDSEKNPMDSFAFDFLQNTKYTYRGMDEVDSESVKSNEEQMKKVLAEIQS